MPTPALAACPACAGFVPAARPTCPHCDAALPRGPSRGGRLAGALARMAASGAVAVTLMACYGAMPRPYPAEAFCADDDRDGACVDHDCDNADPQRYPGAADPDLDGIDQNCDGVDGWRDAAEVAAPDPAAPDPSAPDPTMVDPTAPPAPPPDPGAPSP